MSSILTAFMRKRISLSVPDACPSLSMVRIKGGRLTIQTEGGMYFFSLQPFFVCSVED